MAENPHKPPPVSGWTQFRDEYLPSKPMLRNFGLAAIPVLAVIAFALWTRHEHGHGELVSASLVGHELSVAKRFKAGGGKVNVYYTGRTDTLDVGDGHRVSRTTEDRAPEPDVVQVQPRDRVELRVGAKQLVLVEHPDSSAKVRISATTADGKVAWTTALDNRAIAGAWAVDDRIVLLMRGADDTDAGEAVALDATDGHLLWHTDT